MENLHTFLKTLKFVSSDEEIKTIDTTTLKILEKIFLNYDEMVKIVHIVMKERIYNFYINKARECIVGIDIYLSAELPIEARADSLKDLWDLKKFPRGFMVQNIPPCTLKKIFNHDFFIKADSMKIKSVKEVDLLAESIIEFEWQSSDKLLAPPRMVFYEYWGNVPGFTCTYGFSYYQQYSKNLPNIEPVVFSDSISKEQFLYEVTLGKIYRHEVNSPLFAEISENDEDIFYISKMEDF